MLGCAEQHQAFSQRLWVPTSLQNGSEQGEGGPLEDSSPASKGSQQNLLGELTLLFPWRHSHKWHLSEEG